MKSKRGFAAMSPEKQREIARSGGKAAHAAGTAHQWTPEEARRAGTKGGQMSKAKRKSTIAELVKKRKAGVGRIAREYVGEE